MYTGGTGFKEDTLLCTERVGILPNNCLVGSP